jgi:hypothetical protein
MRRKDETTQACPKLRLTFSFAAFHHCRQVDLEHSDTLLLSPHHNHTTTANFVTMAAVAAHLTRVARVSTNTRVQYVQQYMKDQQGESNSTAMKDSRLCTTMSRLQFDGYDWDVSDEQQQQDVDGLARRLTRKVTTVPSHPITKDSATSNVDPAATVPLHVDDVPPPGSPKSSRPKILARFDTEARMLMSPSRPRLFGRTNHTHQAVDDTSDPLTTTSDSVKTTVFRMAPARSRVEATAAAAVIPEPEPATMPHQAPVTPILTTRRFREGRSSFLNRSTSQQSLAEV